MSNCNQYIEQIFLHPEINKLVSNINPIELQDDLKQELMLSLLEMGCKKITKLHKEKQLLPYSLKALWNIAISPRSKFYKLYKKNNTPEAILYFESLKGNSIEDSLVYNAQKILNQKMLKSAKDAHESIIFQKWVELRSHQAVANYFGIPRLHVMKVCNNTKEQLKKEIKNKL